MHSTALPLVSTFCAAVHSSPTLTSKPSVLSYEPVQGPGPFILHLPYIKTHHSFYGTHATSSTKRSGEIEGIALEVWQSTCNTHCNGNYTNPADTVGAQNGLLNHFDQGYAYFRGHIVCKTDSAYGFGCDYGSG